MWEGLKVWWLWLGGVPLTVWWTVRLFREKKVTITLSEFLFFLFILVLFIASLTGVHPVDSLVGGSYRHQGVLFFITLWLVMLTCRIISGRQKELLLKLLALGVIGESVVVIIQKLIDMGVRPLGTFGEPNAVAGYIAVGLYFVLTARLKPWVKYCAFLLAAAAIIATGSRTGIVVAVVLVSGLIIGKMKARIPAYILTGCILAAAIVLLGTLSGSRIESNYESRSLFWRLGWNQFLEKPLLGYGAESGEVVYNHAFLANHIRLVDFMVDRAHNIFLDIALWSGIIGLLVFCAWLVSLFVSKPYLRRLALAAWLIFAFFQPLGAVHWLQLVLIAAL